MADRNSVILFEEECKDCQKLFKKKNEQYGNSIWKTGVLGAVVEIMGATARLPMMVLRRSDHGRDTFVKLVDVLMDIHNYATIALMMVHENNWEGED